ncbi:MAG: hypothetical protein GY938_03875 [Ketobacter sp.]|nr:hypothetical protein [Ketobacter sp.]
MTNDEKHELREIAKTRGLFIGRGREKDWGSINKLVNGIAVGRLLVIENPAHFNN